MQFQTITLNEKRNVTLTAILQDVGGDFRHVTRRPAILVLPGGAYAYCSDREAEPIAFPYVEAGYQAFVLRYSVQEHAVWPNPLNDYEEAMTMIRERADEWHIYPDKIAVIGFSAGGHLASAAATLSKQRPNAAILCYAVTDEGVHHVLPNAPVTYEAVDCNTCPCFLFATRNDGLVHISNSLKFMDALDRYDIAFECHIYASGMHGVAGCNSAVMSSMDGVSARIPQWIPDSIGWLKDIFGDFTRGGTMSAPICAPVINGNHAPFLSVECTFDKLMRIPASRGLLNDLFARGRQNGWIHGDIDTQIIPAGRRKLLDVLRMQSAPQEEIDALEKALSSIPNPDPVRGN